MSEREAFINRICWEQVKPNSQLKKDTELVELDAIVEDTLEDKLDKEFCLNEFKELHKSLAYLEANQKTIIEAHNDLTSLLNTKSKKKLSPETEQFSLKSVKFRLNCLIFTNTSILMLLATILALCVYGLYLLASYLT